MKYNLEQPIRAKIGTLKYQCTVEWRNGSFVADEPVKAGGGDAGPDPYSLFLSSVATCTLITLRMYIDHKGWDISSIAINVNMYQVKKEDMVTTVIDRDMRILQPLTDEQRDRLTEIAQACPISRVLEGEIRMRTHTYNEIDTADLHGYTNGEVIMVPHADAARTTCTRVR